MPSAKRLLNDITPPLAKRLVVPLLKRMNPNYRPQERETPPSEPFVAPNSNPKFLAYVVGDPVVKIPVDRIRYPNGCAYTNEKHHFSLYYKYGLEHLRRYYQENQPRNIFEFFGIEPQEKKHIESHDLPLFPWLDEIGYDFHGGEHGLTRDHGNQGFGPVSEKKLRLEAARLDQVLRSVRERGFLPEIGGYTRGYIMLKSTGQWVFVVRQGLHRTAALVQLQFKDIDVQFSQMCPRFIEEADVREWPMVKRSQISERDALAMFFEFF